MLTQSSKYKLYLLFKAISENEQIVEEQRQRLSLQLDFEPYAAFKRIDRLNQDKINAHDICNFLKENMVDYADEVECFYMFRYFDKDNDGYLDFDDFLQLTLPADDIQKRAETAQRPNYRVGKDQRLPKHIEFELSRLIEKEMHYHVKVEIEKKTFERQPDFNTVASFTIIDSQKYGFLDFDNMKKFLQKFKKEIKKPDINAIIRRLDIDGDNKISFREFSQGLTPEYPGLEQRHMEFNIEKKEELIKKAQENKKTQIREASHSPLRDYRNIYFQNDQDSPIKKEFSNLKLKQQIDPEMEFLIDLRKVGSPEKKVKKENIDQSKRLDLSKPIQVRQTSSTSVNRNQDIQDLNKSIDQLQKQEKRKTSQFAALANLANSAKRNQKQLSSKDNDYQNLTPEKRTPIPYQNNNNDGQNRTPQSQNQRVPGFSEESEFQSNQSQQQMSTPKQQDLFQDNKRMSTIKNNHSSIIKTPQSQNNTNDYIDIISVLAIGAELEFQVEQARQQLVANCEDFNTIDAFRYLDKQGQGFIDPHDLIQSLKTEIGIDYQTLEDDVIMIFQKFDKDESREMKYSEFCDAFAPKEPNLLKELAGRVPRNVNLTMNFAEMFSNDTRELYRECWMQHFMCEKETEILRQRLLKNPFFDLQKAFKTFDTQNKGFIVIEDIGKALQLNGHNITGLQLKLLFSKFNRQIQDNTVNYAEFIEEITPRAPLFDM
eukprot:403341661